MANHVASLDHASQLVPHSFLCNEDLERTMTNLARVLIVQETNPWHFLLDRPPLAERFTWPLLALSEPFDSTAMAGEGKILRLLVGR